MHVALTVEMPVLNSEAFLSFDQVLVSQSVSSPHVTRLVVPDDEVLAAVDELHLQGVPTVGFVPRQTSQTPMIVQVGMVTGSRSSTVQVNSGVELSILTQSSIHSDTASLNNTIFVASGGFIEFPEMVVVEKDTVLELCGGLAARTRDIDIQEGGVFKTAFPAFTGSRGDGTLHDALTLYSIKTRQGGLVTSSRCGSSGELSLHLTYLNRTDDFSNPTGISISTGVTEIEIEQPRAPLPNVTCILNSSSLVLYKGQECELPPGEHVFTTVTLETGSRLILEGDATGTQNTLIHADTIEVKTGALITGVGSGYQNTGEGASLSSSIGGSYGGTGAGNPVGHYAVFGNMTAPRKYGGSGYQATESTGRGGGQLHLEVRVLARIDGTIDVSGNGGERLCRFYLFTVFIYLFTYL